MGLTNPNKLQDVSTTHENEELYTSTEINFLNVFHQNFENPEVLFLNEKSQENSTA